MNVVKISVDLEEIMDEFLKNRFLEIEHGKEALKEGDLEEVGNILHSLKGVLGSYGFDEIYVVVKKIYERFKDGVDQDLMEEFLKVEDYLMNTKIEYVEEEF